MALKLFVNSQVPPVRLRTFQAVVSGIETVTIWQLLFGFFVIDSVVFELLRMLLWAPHKKTPTTPHKTMFKLVW